MEIPVDAFEELIAKAKESGHDGEILAWFELFWSGGELSGIKKAAQAQKLGLAQGKALTWKSQ